MSKAKNVGVVAAVAAAVVCTHSAMALDLPGAGETYTVPANTTNEVTEADMAAFNALGKVLFTDETSALRFTSATAPNVPLEGAGWMIKDSADTWKISRTQTTAWTGTWDLKKGTTNANAWENVFFHTSLVRNIYVRKGAELGMVDNNCRNAFCSSIIHLAGKLSLGGGGSSVKILRIVLDDNASMYCGGTVRAEFEDVIQGGVTYEGGIDFNGHYLNVSTGSKYNSVLYFNSGTDFLGPGSIRLDERIAYAIQVKSTAATADNGVLDIKDMVVTSSVNVANLYPAVGDFGKFGLVRQNDSKIVMNTLGRFGCNVGMRPAYLLESGLLNAQNGLVMNGGTNAARSAYIHFRQTGGDFSASKLMVTNKISGLYADLAFGGSGTAKIGSGGLHVDGDVAFSFLDGMKFSLEDGVGILGGHRIWAYNGGTAESRFLSTGGFSLPDGDFFALDGGAIAYGHSSAGTASDLFGSNPEIRVYGRGGGIAVNSATNVDISAVNFCEPQGDVLQSIEMSDELRNKTWKTPPAVEIIGGGGSNAAAIVDFDFDNRKVTNITVVCKGEGFTSAPTANLRYTGSDALLSTPLTCNVEPAQSGSLTFSSTNIGAYVNLKGGTNYLHGSLVIDMDQLGLIDGSNRTDGAALTANSVVLYFKNTDIVPPYFPNLTNIVIKSGALLLSSSYGYKHHPRFNFLNSCYSIEMYGGHLGGGSVIMTNFVLGGTAWLTGHQINRGVNSVTGESSPYWADLQITSKRIADGRPSDGGDLWPGWRTTTSPEDPGTMTVDVDATPDGEPSKLFGGTLASHSGSYYKSGSIRFGGTEANPSTLTIKNYESLRKTKGRKTLLDLSDDSINVFGTNNVNAVTPPDIAAYGEIKWSPVQRKLYWMPAGGMYLIFK